MIFPFVVSFVHELNVAHHLRLLLERMNFGLEITCQNEIIRLLFVKGSVEIVDTLGDRPTVKMNVSESDLIELVFRKRKLRSFMKDEHFHVVGTLRQILSLESVFYLCRVKSENIQNNLLTAELQRGNVLVNKVSELKNN